ncbi:MHYT domain-containing protein [Thalassobaculum sp.]|uniref:MHYT domain-containing protein n=1 Tax=Thalassobaculum sp. TaxID=2022740 RepID=UPI0032EBEC5A
MLKIYDCIADRHEAWLVVLAGAVCLFASYTAFSLVARARSLDRSARLAWLAAAAATTGGGVWATHFIAMLAYTADVPVGYDLGLTAASVAVAVALAGTGLLAMVVAGAPVLGGAVIGVGVVSMHYLGMAAFEVPAVKLWDPAYVAASVLIGMAGGAGAFAAAGRGPLERPLSVGLLVLTICGLHFTGMAAFSLRADPRIALPDTMIAPDWLAVAVAVVAMLIVGFGLLGAMIDERLARRNATEAERLRRHVVELEATKRDLQATTEQLQAALQAAAAGSEAKTQFLATMSHELRTPLNAVIGFAEMMNREIYGPHGDPRYAEFARTIVSSGQHLLDLINDVLDVSGLDAGRLELQETDIDVGELVDGALRMLEGQADQAGLRLEAEVPANLPALSADARRLRQVLLNLVSNALKFTPEGGRVTVSAAVDSAGLTVSVADTGIGIAAEDVPRALEPFEQVDSRLSRRYQGSGLGLPLSRQLVELHGGTLSIESAVGTGTTVTVTLPPGRLRPRATAA